MPTLIIHYNSQGRHLKARDAPDHAHPSLHTAETHSPAAVDDASPSSSPAASSHLLTVNDALQRVSVSVSSLLRDTDGWACHWSPCLYKVTAQAVWTDPLLANASLYNAAEVSGRIAVVLRGSVPVVVKARNVQVLYCKVHVI